MTITEYNQIIGNCFIFLLGCFLFFTTSQADKFPKYGRMIAMYVSIFLVFASLIRGFVFIGVLTPVDGLTINGLAALIPLAAGIITYRLDL